MLNFIYGTTVHDKVASLGLLFFRILFGVTVAFGHGIGKIPVTDEFVGMVESMGLPAPALFAWLSGITEFGGGLLVAAGFQTRTASIFLTINFFMAAVVFHANDPWQAKELAFVFLLSSLMLCFTGGGKYALDRFIRR